MELKIESNVSLEGVAFKVRSQRSGIYAQIVERAWACSPGRAVRISGASKFAPYQIAVRARKAGKPVVVRRAVDGSLYVSRDTAGTGAPTTTKKKGA